MVNTAWLHIRFGSTSADKEVRQIRGATSFSSDRSGSADLGFNSVLQWLLVTRHIRFVLSGPGLLMTMIGEWRWVRRRRRGVENPAH